MGEITYPFLNFKKRKCVWQCRRQSGSYCPPTAPVPQPECLLAFVFVWKISELFNLKHNSFILGGWKAALLEQYGSYQNLTHHADRLWLRPKQNGDQFSDNIFKGIILNEKHFVLINISPKFVPKGRVGNKLALVQVMVCCWTGYEPLPERMMTQFTDAYMRHQASVGWESTVFVLPVIYLYWTRFQIKEIIIWKSLNFIIWLDLIMV